MPSDTASIRILRLALATSLCLAFSQIVNWDLSFVAAVFTMFILVLPLPALKLKSGIVFVIVLTVAVYGGLALLPLLLNQRWVGILLLSLAMFYCFYHTARGGNPIIGTFATIGLGLATAVGTVSIDGALTAAKGLSVAAMVGILFVWIGHALIPDPISRPAQPPPQEPPPAKPGEATARRNAFRSLVIVMPVLMFFLLSSASASYLALMIKVVSMARQASGEQTKQVAKSLLVSTLIGGVAAMIAWEVLTIWPSLLMYTLLVALGGLVMGARIFTGSGLHPTGPTWSYGYLTMLVVLAPAVMDGIAGNPAGAAFWSRLMMFGYATVYGVGAVWLFDTLWPAAKNEPQGQLA